MDEQTDEELKQTVSKKKLWFLSLYTICCIVSLLCSIIYINPDLICITLILCIGWFIVKNQHLHAFVRIMLMAVVFVVIYAFTFLPLYILLDYRHPWQYEMEMKPYRESPGNVFYFPETIPDCATDIKFELRPTVMQAKGYITLSFIADDAYIRECKEKYIDWFTEYGEYIPEPGIPLTESVFYQNSQVNLYSIFEETYNQYYTPELKEAFSISEKEATETVLQWILPQNVHLTDAELRSATQYHICDHLGQGFIVLEDTNRIIFYKDYEG